MANFTKETLTTEGTEGREATGSQTFEYLVYFVFGILEILLGFRFVLKLLGASLSSNFVSSIYSWSRVFVMPFEGIFRRGVTEGVETAAVFEPATLMAILVYAVIAWGIASLVGILSGERQ